MRAVVTALQTQLTNLQGLGMQANDELELARQEGIARLTRLIAQMDRACTLNGL